MLLFYGLLLAFLPVLVTKVKANQDLGGGPPPAFVAVVPTSIIGDFEGFPYLLEAESTTTTTTTTPAPFGKTFFKAFFWPFWTMCTLLHMAILFFSQLSLLGILTRDILRVTFLFSSFWIFVKFLKSFLKMFK